ncbi:DNA polymerase Y family protein [Actinacidiphila soli]|uniref:DNA polymerase Y family protein n=1 Tax=Actinacidiphila soli TaxID=2487275 RepID=UPI000FCAA5E0|nr:hypothetical protein [Actinacidiphila soli]
MVVPAQHQHPHPDPGPCVLYIRCGPVDRATYAGLAELVAQFTPLVETVPPDAILADVRAAVRYFDRLPEQLALMIGTRATALYDVRLTIGAAGNRTVAAMAAGGNSRPGRVRAVDTDPEAVADFLRPQPVDVLYGIGEAAARTLTRRGLFTVGQVAVTPLPVLQGILGTDTGRTVWERANGIDPHPVTAEAPTKSLTADRLFNADTVGTDAVRRSVLELADALGRQLRGSGQTASALALTIGLTGGSSLGRARTLPAPTGHTAALADAALDLYEGLTLRDTRVRAVALRAENLAPASTRPDHHPPASPRARSVMPATLTDRTRR